MKNSKRRCKTQGITQEQLQEIAREIPNQYIEENEMPTLLERTEQKGIQKGKIESILLLLSSRFGFVPPQVVEQLNTIEQTDVFRLNDLLIFASKCESIEEFEKAL